MLHVMLMVILFGVNDMPTVNFDGRKFAFPEGTSKAEMEDVFNRYTAEVAPAASGLRSKDTDGGVRSSLTNVNPVEDYAGVGEDGNPLPLPEPPKLNEQETLFAENIADIETGGVAGGNRFIRTQVKPDDTGKGSSAYGTYQITRGLLTGALESDKYSFTEPETKAINELRTRQEIALTIGGRDRTKFQKGGPKHSQALNWAKRYGYEDVESFLNDFDYGGTYGLDENADFQILYESVARKLLSTTLKEAGGDPVKAAAIWHGGSNSSKWGKTTEIYKQKMLKRLNK